MTIAEQISRAKADYDAVYEAGKKSVLQELTFTDVESSTYRITVPNGASPFARVNKIGGMTYKCKNLFEYPYADTTWTSNGITFTDNGDGSITLNGTNNGEGNSAFYLYSNKKKVNLPAGTYRASISNYDGDAITIIAYFDGNYISIKHTPLTLTETTTLGIYIQVEKGRTETFNNVTIYPMLNEGSTALPYEPYFKGLRSGKVTELESDGANLIPFPYSHASGRVSNGITYTYGDDGVVTLDGVSTGYSEMLLFANKQLKAGTYVLRAFGADGSIVSVLQMYKNSSWVRNVAADEGNGKTFTITDEDAKNHIFTLNIYVGKVNANFNNRQIKPMLVYGSIIPSEYKPYVGKIDTLTIPEAVKSLDGYGLGVDSEFYNYIDFERKVFVQRIKKVVFTGDETITKYPYGNYDSIIRFIGTWLDDGRAETSKLLCSHFNYGVLVPNTVYIGSGYSRGSFAIDTSFFTTETTNAEYEATFKAWLKEQYDNGNPVTVVYDLATPIETDISAYLTDEYIEVEGGGTITAVNEHALDVPTNISYLIDSQGG